MVKLKDIKCKWCQYTWKTTAKLNYVTCPNCQKKTDSKVKPGSIGICTQNAPEKDNTDNKEMDKTETTETTVNQARNLTVGVDFHEAR